MSSNTYVLGLKGCVSVVVVYMKKNSLWIVQWEYIVRIEYFMDQRIYTSWKFLFYLLGFKQLLQHFLQGLSFFSTLPGPESLWASGLDSAPEPVVICGTMSPTNLFYLTEISDVKSAIVGFHGVCLRPVKRYLNRANDIPFGLSRWKRIGA